MAAPLKASLSDVSHTIKLRFVFLCIMRIGLDTQFGSVSILMSIYFVVWVCVNWIHRMNGIDNSSCNWTDLLWHNAWLTNTECVKNSCQLECDVYWKEIQQRSSTSNKNLLSIHSKKKCEIWNFCCGNSVFNSKLFFEIHFNTAQVADDCMFLVNKINAQM